MTSLANQPKKPVGCLLVDDHPLIRSGLCSLLGSTTDFIVSGLARDGKEAVAYARSNCPDLVVLDISMPTWGGYWAIPQFKTQFSSCRILCFTMDNSFRSVQIAFGMGANGYALKTDTPAQLLAGMRHTTQRKRPYLSPHLDQSWLPALENNPTKTLRGAGEGSSLTACSPREIQTLIMIAQGLRTSEISNALQISGRTVDKHRASMMLKLSLKIQQRLLLLP